MKHAGRIRRFEKDIRNQPDLEHVWRVWFREDGGIDEDTGDGVRRPVTWELMPILSAEGRMPLCIYEGLEYRVAQ